MVGKHDAAAIRDLVPWTGELSPLQLVPILAERLDRFFPGEKLMERAKEVAGVPRNLLSIAGATRTPYFCSGCPHNSSTKLPDGSAAASGIGCHVMASWMNRNTVGFAQMGGEGVPIAVAQMFNGGQHMFQNIGEGTWYHSGSLAVRQAIAAGANITFKILFNDAVAMTGGQPVDGPISPAGVAQSCRAEGIIRIAVVSDEPDMLTKSDFPHSTSFHHRDEMDHVQREMRDIRGVTALIYVQTCATEKRRRRKRGTLEDPKRFAVINPLVCEGCGDCSVESNCLSVEPLETEFGRKRQINLSTCNKDFSCLNGFCPSFVTVEGATRRKAEPTKIDIGEMVAALPLPSLPDLSTPYNLLITGVGGTGVVTIGALISMAAHLEGKGISVLDFTGFAQKFGTVLSYVRVGATFDAINQVRIDQGAADAVIGCDIVVSSAPKASAHYGPDTRMVLNQAEMPTGDLVLNRDASLRVKDREAAIRSAVAALDSVDANAMAEALMGDSVFANVILLGMAWQKGLIPVGLPALERAVEMNNVAQAKNLRAISIGRVLAVNPSAFDDSTAEGAAETVEDIIQHRVAYLTDYQDAAYGALYEARLRDFSGKVAAEHREVLLDAAARSLFKVMAYKDEYEVARLQTDPTWVETLSQRFDGPFRTHFHMAPPMVSWRKDARGRPIKRSFGPWLRPVLKALARMRYLRGTAFDPFGYTAERKEERDLIAWFEGLMDVAVAMAKVHETENALDLLEVPLAIRGYGPVKSAAIASERKRAQDMISAFHGAES